MIPSQLHCRCCTGDELYTWMYNLRGDGHYVAYIRGGRCDTHQGFDRELSAALQFQDYYGENMNAFDECIADLEWLHAERVYVVIDQAERFMEFDRAQDGWYTRHLVKAVVEEPDVSLTIVLRFQSEETMKKYGGDVC